MPATECSRWDLRAHGRSGSPDEAITLHTLAADLAAVVRAAGGPGARARALGGRGDHDAVRARPSGARTEPRPRRHRERVQRARIRLVRVARGDRGGARRRGAPQEARLARRDRCAHRSRTASRASRGRWVGFTRHRSRARLEARAVPDVRRRRREGFPRCRRLGDHQPPHRRVTARGRDRSAGTRSSTRTPRASTRCCSGS
mgnify:CR=1 FL=1